MCLPDLGLSAILTMASTAVSAAGTIAGTAAQVQAADYQQKQQNMLAEDALKRGAQEEEGQRRKTAALQARQKAVMAASGLDVSTGSPLAILADTAQLGELDAQVIKDNARRQAWTHKGNAAMAGMQKKNAMVSGVIGTFSTVLGGANQLADKWYKPTTAGAFASGPVDPWENMRW